MDWLESAHVELWKRTGIVSNGFVVLCLVKITCLVDSASIRRRPMPIDWLDQRRPLLGIILLAGDEPASRKIFPERLVHA